MMESLNERDIFILDFCTKLSVLCVIVLLNMNENSFINIVLSKKKRFLLLPKVKGVLISMIIQRQLHDYSGTR